MAWKIEYLEDVSSQFTFCAETAETAKERTKLPVQENAKPKHINVYELHNDEKEQNATIIENNNKEYRRVLNVLTTDATYECEQCAYLSPSRALLATHRHRKHTLKTKQLYCPKCNKRFDTRKQLERHLLRPTCEIYPKFTCEYCDKEYIGLANYKIHLRFHTKQYPFICNQCDKRFMMATHLNNHIKTKHENQRYFCEQPQCNKTFQTLHSLKSHAYVHLALLPYKCEYCDRTYASKGRLRWHIKKKHGIVQTLQELDRMLVAAPISIKAQLKPLAGEQEVEEQATQLILDDCAI